MKWLVSETPQAAARAAAAFIAARLKEAIQARGQAILAISGGDTPWEMFDCLAQADVPWEAVQVFQVDERRVPASSPERNWSRFTTCGLASRMPVANLHPAPVELEPAQRAARSYEQELLRWAGDPPLIDVIHLGLGLDGHTASLFPGDPLLDEQTRWVGISHSPQGMERLSLTFPALNRARTIVWFVLGAGRREIVSRFFDKDPSFPATRVADAHAALFTDEAAAQP